jgi:hypothetical protein
MPAGAGGICGMNFSWTNSFKSLGLRPFSTFEHLNGLVEGSCINSLDRALLGVAGRAEVVHWCGQYTPAGACGIGCAGSRFVGVLATTQQQNGDSDSDAEVRFHGISLACESANCRLTKKKSRAEPMPGLSCIPKLTWK